MTPGRRPPIDRRSIGDLIGDRGGTRRTRAERSHARATRSVETLAAPVRQPAPEDLAAGRSGSASLAELGAQTGPSDVTLGKNVKIETLVSPETAARILERLAERYFAHFAVVAYLVSVEVVRGDKYA